MGYVEANSKKEARSLIEEDYNSKMCMKSKSEDIGVKNLFLLNIYEPDVYWDNHWNEEHECSVCNQNFTKLQRGKTFDFESIKSGYCCPDCEEIGEYEADRNKEGAYLNKLLEENIGVELPCIYKITHKITNKVYIGQTTQAVTYRWYQHFKRTNGGTKFYDEIVNSSIVEWIFEVVEVIDKDAQRNYYEQRKEHDRISKYINTREQYWINQFDSINSGYNSGVANKELHMIHTKYSDGLFELNEVNDDFCSK
jgi:hypothetical protein